MIKPKQSSFKATKNKLIRARRNVRRFLISESKIMAGMMQKYARLMAPRQTMSLENAIFGESSVSRHSVISKVYVNENYGVTNRPSYQVGSYAKIMHSGTYSLGPISQAKNRVIQRYKMYVGNQFLNRAGQLTWNKRRDVIKRGIIKAMNGGSV